ncbi:metallophosphoesterase [Mesobacillus maritimus]|uniref:metallophosphoesterase n=1 Tax=Mesobacillus maritimus TaxID=1643336 RepID=UPI00203CAC4C|nr:metallophosphoesterase [Mesobacillus maritimus]MCM3586475.1 metallophosphoesterase [Mesobacillus maritimus]MCM3669493.1 metallophosphoesterase [Mesobacillus maritimus]
MSKEAQADRVLVHHWAFSELPVQKDPITIFFISDIHKRTVTQTIIKKAKAQADFVIVGGDLAEKGVSLGQIKANLVKLKEIGPVYFVWGNNDYELDHESLKELMKKLDIVILENTAVCLIKQKVTLLGVEDLSMEKDDLEQAVNAAGNSPFKILVSHNPKIVDSLTPEQNIQLILSGHTHGGQIRVFGFGPYEKGGIKRINNTRLFVSNGYGTTALPLRLGAKAETHIIKITSSSTS